MGTAIRFLLGDEERAVAGLPPTTTVLEYLRREARLTGTKEGCAEGDCGACTVILREPDGAGGLRHVAVNACIQFVGSLHLRQCLTVEHLAEGGALHPVQAALVAHHGSQCGFCTPGFAVQIAAGAAAGKLSNRQAVKDWIAGNLCRCTGYGGIVEAGLAAAGAPLTREDDGIAARLAALDDGEMLAYAHAGESFLQPRSLDDLAGACAADPQAVLVAGATDIGLWVTKQRRRLPALIDVTRVPELKRIEEGPEGVSFGAAVTHARARPALARLHPDLDELMRRFAGEQIRAAGTVGGNIANGSPIGDLAPALIALGATLHLRRGGARRAIPLEDFFLAYGRQDRAPGEFVEAVTVPALAPAMRYGAHKLSKRFDSDISAVMAAFRMTLEEGRVADARIAYGGMAATPKRARAAEAALLGRPFDRAAAAAAEAALAQDFRPISDLRASAGYRLRAARNLLRRFFLESGGADHPTRVLAPG